MSPAPSKGRSGSNAAVSIVVERVSGLMDDDDDEEEEDKEEKDGDLSI